MLDTGLSGGTQGCHPTVSAFKKGSAVGPRQSLLLGPSANSLAQAGLPALGPAPALTLSQAHT